MPQVTSNRRTRKRLATRQKISGIASQLFIERGFDQVTIDEIAEAADVARMTVFNHFPRKEDMFFDLDEQARDEMLAALCDRNARTSPIEALRLFAHQAVADRRPYVRFHTAGSKRFLNTIRASDALTSRARAIRDEITDLLVTALTKSVHRRQPDADARLAASLVVTTWQVAFLEGHRVFRQHRSINKANASFLAIVDRGTRGLKAALHGTRYAG